MDLSQAVSQVARLAPARITLSKPVRKDTYRRAVIRPMILHGEEMYQIERFTDRQAFHENIPEDELPSVLEKELCGSFRELNAAGPGRQCVLMVSKNGAVYYKESSSASCGTKAQQERCPLPGSSDSSFTQGPQNRPKRYLIDPKQAPRPLYDLGVITKEGTVAAPFYDKYRQINRFLEIVEDSLDDSAESLSIIDFGCGRSYLTFLLYDYLTRTKGLAVQLTGVDQKADVIARCRQLAGKYGYEGLTFEVGDINGYEPKEKPDMVVSLHACDTATDYALYNALRWQTTRIFCVPCCQHEVSAQLDKDSAGSLTQYGLFRERFGALVTDALRTELVRACGYRTDVLEFIEESDTPKNLMIRARKIPASSSAIDSARQARERADALVREYGLRQTLYERLKKDDLFVQEGSSACQKG